MIQGWPIVGLAAAGLLAMVAMLLGAHGVGEEGVRAVARATARSSVLLFSLAFASGSLAKLFPSAATRALRRNRRQVGVSFAVSHAIHLVAVIALGRIVGEPMPLATTLGGGLAYAFLAAMTATSFDATARWLGPARWRRLHLAGGWYLWAIFFQSYLGRAIDSAVFALPTALLLAVLGLRAAAYRRWPARAGA